MNEERIKTEIECFCCDSTNTYKIKKEYKTIVDAWEYYCLDCERKFHSCGYIIPTLKPF